MDDNSFMLRAIELAKEALKDGEIPVGAVVVRDGKIIGEGKNLRERTKNSMYHAEILAIEEACKNKGDWRLDDCDIYVTLEPCPMCSGAILMSRIKKIVFGAYSPQGALVSKIQMFDDYASNANIIGGYMAEECARLIENFV